MEFLTLNFSEDSKKISETVGNLWHSFYDKAKHTNPHSWSIPLFAEVGNQKIRITYRDDYVEVLPKYMPDSGVGLYIYVDGSSAINAPEVTCLVSRSEPYVRILALKTSDLARHDVVETIPGSKLPETDKLVITNQIRTAISGDFKLDPEKK